MNHRQRKARAHFERKVARYRAQQAEDTRHALEVSIAPRGTKSTFALMEFTRRLLRPVRLRLNRRERRLGWRP